MKLISILNKLLVILSFIFSSALYAQTIYEHDLDEQRLKELKEKIQHLSKKPEQWTYKNDQDYKEALRKYHQGQGERGFSDKNGNGNGDSDYDNETAYESDEIRPELEESDFRWPKGNLGPLGQVILYVVLGALLVTIIYFLFINSNYKKNGPKYVPIDIDDTAPADIPKTELERLLEEALNEKNYRKAVRVYYLFILKDLSEKQWISWEKQKTNMHYVHEMQGKKEAKDFSNAVTYFEFIWYGKRHITEVQFKSVQPSFITLLNVLNIK